MFVQIGSAPTVADVKALLRALPWIRPHRRFGAAAIVCTLASVLINLTVPFLTSRVIDLGIAERDSSFVWQTVLLMLVLIVLGMAVAAVSAAMSVRFAFHSITDLRRDLYDHTQGFSFGNLDTMSSGEVLTRLTSDMTKVQTALMIGMVFATQIPIMFFGALAAIVILDLSLSVIPLAMVPIIALLVGYTLSRSQAMYDAVQRRLDRLNTVVQENIEGAELVKAFVRQDHEIERFDEVVDDLADQATIVNQLVASLQPTLIAVSSLGIAAVLWLGGANVIAGDLSDGKLVAFISYMALVSMPMIMFSFLQPLLSAAGASMIRIDEVLSQNPDVIEHESGIDLASCDNPGDITFENVSFSYQTGGLALCDVDLHVPQGKTVAILGATGSGKSTLVNLIPRFYDATAGRVLIGGTDVRELTKRSLRRSIGIALQEPHLFSGTVMENLRYGRPEATDEEVIAAAQVAQAHDFVTAMGDGYESIVAQGGANLSGGQRQRLSIARTLVVNPSILILDDSTSAVDLETEARIQDALAALSEETGIERTIVIVAQRISSALGADEIVVLDDGRVSGHGTHAELLKTSSVYQEIYRSQLGEPVG